MSNDAQSDDDTGPSDGVGNLRYHEASRFRRDYESLSSSLQSASLKPVVDAFVRNIGRLSAMSVLPHYALHCGAWHQLLLSQAAFEYAGKPIVDSATMIEHPDISKEYLRLAKQDLSEKHKAGMLEVFDNHIEWFSRQEAGTFHDGLMAMLNAQVIGAWTAFETMAKDLWVAAVNQRPKSLGGLDEVSGEKVATLKDLHRYRFDLRDSMGTLLEGKIRLDSLDKFKKYYRAAFQSEGIVDALRDPELFALSEVRNALIHSGGIVDKGFFKHMKSHPVWSTVNLGDDIPLDGQRVAFLTDTVIARGTEVVRGVDSWLDANPPP